MRVIRWWLAISIALGAGGSVPAHGQDREVTTRPDPQKGSALAQRWCASCHLVSYTQKQANDGTPSFREIADRADFNEARLAFFLLVPHPMMPGMSLTRDEVRDLAAYIDSQR